MKLCEANSRVLGNGEKDHIKFLKDNNVTHLSLLGAVKKAQKRLTSLKKRKKKYDKILSSIDSNLPCQLFVEEIDNKDDNDKAKERLDILLE